MEPTTVYLSELLLLSDSLYNANILGRNSAKKLLAFLPATTNPQEPNSRPHTFILSWCLLSGCRFCWACSLSLPKLQPSSTPAAVASCSSVPGICWVHVCPSFPPHIPAPTVSPQPLFPPMSLAKPQADIVLKFLQGKRI